MSRQLPYINIIIPELNTKATQNGVEVAGKLAFYIDGKLKWAVELLIEGGKINERVHRITSGKCRSIDSNTFSSC